MDYRKQLTEDILPFWLEHAIDWKNGGIFTCLDEAGNIYGTEKSVWFQGRSLWTLSKAYNVIDKNPEYLKAATCRHCARQEPKELMKSVALRSYVQFA